MSCDERSFHGDIDRLFAGELPGGRRAALRAHLTSCPSCREYYDRVALVQQRLAPERPLGPLLFGADDVLARFPPESAGWRRWSWWGTGAALLALVVVFAARSPTAPSSARPELQERGGGASALRGVRAFCISAGADGAPSVRDAAPLARAPVSSSLRCGRADSLQFAYSSEGDAFLFLVGLDSEGRLHFYAPREDEPGSIAVRAGAREQPLSGSVRLAVNHPVGRTRLLALFSQRPLPRQQVAAALAAGGAEAARALVDEVQALDLEVTP